MQQRQRLHVTSGKSREYGLWFVLTLHGPYNLIFVFLLVYFLRKSVQ